MNFAARELPWMRISYSQRFENVDQQKNGQSHECWRLVRSSVGFDQKFGLLQIQLVDFSAQFAKRISFALNALTRSSKPAILPLNISRLLRKLATGNSVLVALLLVTAGCSAKKRDAMQRIDLFFKAPDLPDDGTAARPKTIYLAGTRYARIEQFADASSDIKNLIVVNEPDIWLVDGVRETVGHSVNHGPDQEVHNPIIGPEAPDELLSLEYGHEIAFFESAHAQVAAGRVIDGKNCKALQATVGEYHLNLYADAKRDVPVLLSIEKNGDRLFEAHYTKYETDLTFDESLFQPPKGMKLMEADRP